MKLPTVQEMQNLDRSATTDYGIPSIILMENAGVGSVNVMEKKLGPCHNSFALIFVGPGNNGGDGLVIGRHLHQKGCQPVFFFLVNPDSLSGDSAINLDIVKKLKLPFHVIDNSGRVETIPILFKQFESRGLPCYVIVDAILGIGLDREVSNHFADTINLINRPGFRQKTPIISVDTPSGMDADTGKVLGTCVKADCTTTYGCAKPGHYIHGSSQWTGELEIVDIGIPPEAVIRAGIATELITPNTFSGISAKLERQQSSHKGDHGHLLIVAGSAGKTGAAILAAKGAIRSGVGLVSLAVPKDLNPIFETCLPEAMTISLPGSNQYLNIDDINKISDCLDTKHAIVLGPGIGQEMPTTKLVLELFHSALCPVVVDADALNILANNRDELQSPAGPRIFTPHPGELGRLLDKSTESIQDNRLDAALLACNLLKNEHHETVVVVKGAGTIIAEYNGSTFINTTGNPGMATGGMGDVLSGVIAGLICQGLSPLDAAIGGTYLHGAAADQLFEEYGAGFTATEVANKIPLALMAERMPLSTGKFTRQ